MKRTLARFGSLFLACVCVGGVARAAAPNLTAPANVTVSEQTSFPFSGGNALVVTAADAANLSMNLSVTSGVVTLGSLAGVTVTNGVNGSAQIAFTGTSNAINAVLGTLSYSNSLDNPPNDRLNALLHDFTSSVLKQVTINMTTANDGPSLGVPGPQVVDEDTSLSLASVTVSDPDSGTNLVWLRFASAAGALSATGASGAVVSGNNSGTMTITGSIAQITSTIPSVRFIGRPNTNNANNGGNASISVVVNDRGFTGGGALFASNDIAVTLNAVNDRPTLVMTNNSANEDNLLYFPATIGDVDAPETPGYQMAVTVTTALRWGFGFLQTTNGLTFGANSLTVVTNGLSGSTNVLFLLGATNSNISTFSGDITNVAAAMLTLGYVPSLNSNGTHTMTVTLSDAGQSGSGGVLTTSRTVTATIAAVNDAPFIGVGLSTNVGNEGSTLNISLGGALKDSDANETPGADLDLTLTVTNGFLTLAQTNGLTFLSGTNGGASFQVRGALSNLDLAVDPIAYNTPSNFFGNDTLAIVLNDRGNSGGAAKQTNAVVHITIQPINDAPVLDNTGVMSIPAISEDPGAITGRTVTAIIASAGGDRITDGDPGALEGMAVRGADNLNGAWEYSTDAGTTWLPFGSVFDGNAVLLNGAALIRFVPATNYCGSASFSFRAWDQAQGTNGQTAADCGANGGVTAFSTNTEDVTISVACVNDAPVLDNATDLVLTSFNEDTPAPVGDVITNILASAGGDPITDADAADLRGVAIVDRDNSNGLWQYSTNGGAFFANIPAVSDASALLLDDLAWVRFVPNANFAGTAAVVFRAWDLTAGTVGQSGVNVSGNGGTTPYSAATETGLVTVINLNEAPVLDSSGTMTLTSIQKNDFASPGDAVSNLIASAGGDRITDLDAGALEGIAVIAANNAFGLWQFSIDGGTNWSPLNSVLTNSAVLLAAEDRVRFVPNPGFSGPSSIGFHAWDQTEGSSGNSGFDATINGDPTSISTNLETASILVLTTNLAPVLDNTGDMKLSTIIRNDFTSDGDFVADIVLSAGGDRITDADIGAQEGLAVVGADIANGTWQYSLDLGASWIALGAVSDNAATLLNEEAKIRFVPTLNFTGTASLQFRAWDQTDIFTTGATGVDVSVNGDPTAYSVAIETAVVTVVAANVNVAPSLDNSGNMVLPAIYEDDFTNTGATVSSIIASAGGDRITDGNPNALEGVAIIHVETTNGTWQYSTTAGATWNSFLNISNSSAVLLDTNARVRFIPLANLHTFDAGITFRAWDRTDGLLTGSQGVDASASGGTNAYSLATETAYISVIQMANLQVTKSYVGTPVAGTTLVYRVSVTNLGPSDATNVVLTDELPAGVAPTGTMVTNLGTIFAGFAKSVTYTVTLPSAIRGVLTNVASVTSSVLDAVSANDGVTNLAAITTSADLSVVQRTDPAAAPAGELLTYYITVSNAGPSDAIGVVATDALPATVTFVSASTGFTYAAGVVTCPVGDLVRWGSTTVWIRVTVTNSLAASLTNVATAASIEPDPVASNNVSVRTNTTVNGRAQNDFNADGLTDAAVYDTVTKLWIIGQSGGTGVSQAVFGFTGVQPVPADYDGDGKWDIAVYDPASATWFILGTQRGFWQQQFGFAGVTPVPADYDGDNVADLAVYHATSGVWYVQRSTAGFTSVPFGFAGTKPVVGDYDGDGKADLAIYDPATANWYIQMTTQGFISLQFGFSGVTPVPADYDADHRTDLAVYNPGDARWYIGASSEGFISFQFGFSGVVPVPADYDGDGRADPAVMHPASSQWFIPRSTLGFTTFTLGTAGATPVKGGP